MTRALLLVWGILFVVVALTGCDWRCPDPAPPPAPPSISDQLHAIGGLFLFWGGIVLGLGVVVRAILGIGGIGFLGPVVGVLARIPGIAGIAGLAASGGAVSVAVGASFSWLAAHLWAVVLACVAAGLAWAYWHRADIRRWLDRVSQARQGLTK